jgi:hypothetical protein
MKTFFPKDKQQVLLGYGLFWTHQPGHGIGSKTDFWLVRSMYVYILGIEINIKLI